MLSRIDYVVLAIGHDAFNSLFEMPNDGADTGGGPGVVGFQFSI